MIRQLAKINKATLEIKERGILNFYIYVDYEEGMSQGIGGIALDQWSEKNKSRVGTSYGCEVIRRLLIGLDVNDFSEMKGKHVWVYGNGTGLSFKPKGIQLLNVDSKNKPVIFDDIANEFIDKNVE